MRNQIQYDIIYSIADDAVDEVPVVLEQKDLQMISEIMERSNAPIIQRLDRIEGDVSVLKTDVSVLKEDVSVLKEDVSVLRRMSPG